MNNVSIDIETLGTNNTSQIVSVGLAKFDEQGVGETLHLRVKLMPDEPIECTIDTIRFWLNQARRNSASVHDTFFLAKATFHMPEVLQKVREFCSGCTVWANGCKFDLAMLETLYVQNNIGIPWQYNADADMRTLRRLVDDEEIKSRIDYIGVDHNAESDAIWQAHYIITALRSLGKSYILLDIQF